MQSNYILVNLYKTTKIDIISLALSEKLSVWHSLSTFTKGTLFRQKEILHHFTADVFNDYFLSITETLVKSQD